MRHHIGTISELTLLPCKEDEQDKHLCAYSNDIEITRCNDGSMYLSGKGDGQFIYFYPEQVKLLRELLTPIENDD